MPGKEITNSGQQVTLKSYSGGFGTTAAVRVSFTAPAGFAYANIHVAYGLLGTSGWSKRAVVPTS